MQTHDEQYEATPPSSPRFIGIRINSVVNAVDLFDEILINFVKKRFNNRIIGRSASDFSDHIVTEMKIHKSCATQLCSPFLARTKALHCFVKISVHLENTTNISHFHFSQTLEVTMNQTNTCMSAVWEDPGSNQTTSSCVYHDSQCDIQFWTWAAHTYRTA